MAHLAPNQADCPTAPHAAVSAGLDPIPLMHTCARHRPSPKRTTALMARARNSYSLPATKPEAKLKMTCRQGRGETARRTGGVVGVGGCQNWAGGAAKQSMQADGARRLPRRGPPGRAEEPLLPPRSQHETNGLSEASTCPGGVLRVLAARALRGQCDACAALQPTLELKRERRCREGTGRGARRRQLAPHS